MKNPTRLFKQEFYTRKKSWKISFCFVYLPLKMSVLQFVWLFTPLDIALSTICLISSSLTRENLEPTALQEAIFNNARFLCVITR